MTKEAQKVPPDKQLWRLSTSELEQQFETNSENGLSSKEAERRLRQNGPNELATVKKSKLLQFLLQFNNAITYILIAAAIITFVMRHYSDAAVIGFVIVANAIIGYVQERQADNALSKIQDLLVSQNIVVRDGHKIEVAAKDLVVGDLVDLEAGGTRCLPICG